LLMPAAHPVLESVLRKLGGRATLGEEVRSEADLARLVRGRFAMKVLASVKRFLTDQEIAQFVIPARTQRHRRARRERLTVEESDRLVRLARLQALAEDVLGDAGKANRWLRERLPILDGKRPLDVGETEAGARVVEQILAKIDWGAAA
jgi:putative toxin-antitoxin system antitoxin component (TIGR02293 family)